MKKYIFLIILITCSSLIIGQTTEVLDQKFGVNKFKLEQYLKLYKTELNYLYTDKNNVDHFQYKELDKIKVLNEVISDIILGFYKNKLYFISIDFQTYDESKQIEIKNKLQKLFGKGFEGDVSDAQFNYDWGTVWESNKVYLHYVKLSCQSEFRPCTSNLYMNSKKLNQQILSDSF